MFSSFPPSVSDCLEFTGPFLDSGRFVGGEIPRGKRTLTVSTGCSPECVVQALCEDAGCSLGLERQSVLLINTSSMGMNLNVTLLLSDPEWQNTEEPKYFMVKFINNGAQD
jgi:tRNA U55 pseudouridine synthase TruB